MARIYAVARHFFATQLQDRLQTGPIITETNHQKLVLFFCFQVTRILHEVESMECLHRASASKL